MLPASNVATKSLPAVRCRASFFSLGITSVAIAAYENIEITTRSHPEAFPSALRQKRKTQTKVHEADAALLKVRSYRDGVILHILKSVVCRCPKNVQSVGTSRLTLKKCRSVGLYDLRMFLLNFGPVAQCR